MGIFRDTQLLSDKLTCQTYSISWSELQATITKINTYVKFKKMLVTLNQIVTLRRSKIGFNYQKEGPIFYVGTIEARGPTLQDLKMLGRSGQDLPMEISPEYSRGVQGNGILMSPLIELIPQSFEPLSLTKAPPS